jgi:hypothetical protein
MNGKWIGTDQIVNAKITVEIDDRGAYFQGFVYIIDDGELPWLGVGFQTADKKESFQVLIENIWVFNPTETVLLPGPDQGEVP